MEGDGDKEWSLLPLYVVSMGCCNGIKGSGGGGFVERYFGISVGCFLFKSECGKCTVCVSCLFCHQSECGMFPLYHFFVLLYFRLLLVHPVYTYSPHRGSHISTLQCGHRSHWDLHYIGCYTQYDRT